MIDSLTLVSKKKKEEEEGLLLEFRYLNCK